MRQAARILAAALLLAALVAGTGRAAAPATMADMVAAVALVAPSTVAVVATMKAAPDRPPARSTGTGVSYRDGYILTNTHVVQGTVRVQVVLPDGRVLDVDPARGILADPVSDVAVLKVPAGTLPPAAIGDSDSLAVGDPVITVGNPMGIQFRGSAALGVVSGLDRRLGTGYPFIQTDAAVNPGNSGGPLVNLQGQLVGLANAKFSGAGVEYLGLAIPANVAVLLAERLIKERNLFRPWLGADLRERRDPRLGLGVTDQGLYVVGVARGGPAERALLPGDEVLGAGGKPTATLDDLAAILAGQKPGQRLELQVRRGSARFTAQVTLGEYPPVTAAARPPGILMELSYLQYWEAADHGYTNSDQSLDYFAGAYRQETDRGVALLETEFQRMAGLAYFGYRRGQELTEQAIDAAAIANRNKLFVQILLPGAPGDTVSAALLQQGKTVATTADRLAETDRVNLYPPTPLAPGGKPWVGTVLVFGVQGKLDPGAPVTLQVSVNGKEAARFEWDLATLR